MKTIVAGIAAYIVLVGATYAQTLESREDVMKEFAQDLSDLQSHLPQSESEVRAFRSGVFGINWDDLLEQAHDMNAKWSDNPYVEVTGFNITVGIAPSINVQFTFKE